jgi:hypothetical protein
MDWTLTPHWLALLPPLGRLRRLDYGVARGPHTMEPVFGAFSGGFMIVNVLGLTQLLSLYLGPHVWVSAQLCHLALPDSLRWQLAHVNDVNEHGLAPAVARALSEGGLDPPGRVPRGWPVADGVNSGPIQQWRRTVAAAVVEVSGGGGAGNGKQTPTTSSWLTTFGDGWLQLRSMMRWTRSPPSPPSPVQDGGGGEGDPSDARERMHRILGTEADLLDAASTPSFTYIP